VEKGSFRDDLLARIDLWTFPLPGLRERLEDIEPNIGYELDRYAKRTGRRVSFKRDAHERFLRFATTAEAKWTRNFRDLNGAIIRMATLADTGRIEIRLVEEEITRLSAIWQIEASGGESYRLLKLLIGKERLSQMDYFDRIQLEGVLKVCRESQNLSEAGRILYNASRSRKNSNNDSDRLGKYLLKYGLKLSQIHEVASSMR
jgi:transcriptional regulatory protein RtcR